MNKDHFICHVSALGHIAGVILCILSASASCLLLITMLMRINDLSIGQPEHDKSSYAMRKQPCPGIPIPIGQGNYFDGGIITCNQADYVTRVTSDTFVRCQENVSQTAVSYVQWDFPSIAGLSTIIGRSFQNADIKPGSEPVVIICERLWKELMKSSPEAIGQTLFVAGIPRKIIGVVPDFVMPEVMSTVLLPC